MFGLTATFEELIAAGGLQHASAKQTRCTHLWADCWASSELGALPLLLLPEHSVDAGAGLLVAQIQAHTNDHLQPMSYALSSAAFSVRYLQLPRNCKDTL